MRSTKSRKTSRSSLGGLLIRVEVLVELKLSALECRNHLPRFGRACCRNPQAGATQRGCQKRICLHKLCICNDGRYAGRLQAGLQKMNLGIGKIPGDQDPVAQVRLFLLAGILRFGRKLQTSSPHLRQSNGLRELSESARSATSDELVVC